MAKEKKSNGANLGFEQKLWSAADKLRSNMDAAEYKHVVLGLIFLKYISDAFKEVYEAVKNDAEKLSDPEDIDEYKSRNVFWVAPKARWDYLQSNAKQPIIGKIIDDAMDEIEKNNPILKGVLPKNYARPALDKARLGELIDLIGTIGLGDAENRSKDILGRVYEYFLGKFARAEGKKGGQFYTPSSIVKLLVEMLEPYKGRVFDPCCGSGGMFVQSEKFVRAHGGRIGDVSIYGQESNQTTWRLCKMNLAIRGIDANIQWNNEGSFINDSHKDLKADFIIANPPFNDSDWNGELLREDIRWKYGIPPAKNANFAWVQHFIYHLSSNGKAGFVLGNGSLVSDDNLESTIRKKIIEEDLVECIVTLPEQLFFTTDIPACLWFLNKNKGLHTKNKILFIDARKLFQRVDRKLVELTEEHVQKIVGIYKKFKHEALNYKDIKGFCNAVDLETIRRHDYFIAPGRFVDVFESINSKSFSDKLEPVYAMTQKITKNSNLDKAINDFIFDFGSILFKKKFADYDPKKHILINTDSGKSYKEGDVISIGELVEEVSEKNQKSYDFPVFSVTKNRVFVLSEEYFSKRVYSKELQQYKIIRKGYFGYNPARINIGSLAFFQDYDIGLVSPAYTVFKCKEGIEPLFIWYLLNSFRIFELIRNFCIGTVRQVFRFSDFSFIKIIFPFKEEVDEFVRTINNLVEIKKNNELVTIYKFQSIIEDFLNEHKNNRIGS